jgi:hypothetical protein
MLDAEELELIFSSDVPVDTPMVKIDESWADKPAKPRMSAEDKKALRDMGMFSIDGKSPGNLTRVCQAALASQVPASAPAVTKLVSVEDYRRVGTWLESMIGTDQITLSTRDARIKDLQLGVDFHPGMSSDDEVVSHSILYEEAARTLHNLTTCGIAAAFSHEDPGVTASAVSNWLGFVSSKLAIRLSYLLNRSKRRTTYISVKECLYNLHLRGTGYFDDRVFDKENLSELAKNLKEIREASPESDVDIMAVNVCVWKLSEEQEELSQNSGYEALTEFNNKVQEELMYFLNNFSHKVASHRDDEIYFGTGFGDRVRSKVLMGKEHKRVMGGITLKLTKEQTAEADRYDAELREADLPNIEEALRVKTELRVLEQQKYFHNQPSQIQLAIRDKVLKDHGLDLLEGRTVTVSSSTLMRKVRDAESGSLFLRYMDWDKVSDVHVAALLKVDPKALGLFKPDAEVLDRIYNAYPSLYPILKASRKSKEHYLRYIHYTRTHSKSDNFVSKLLNTFCPPDIGLPTLQMPMTLDIVLALTNNVPNELAEWFSNEAPGFSDNKEFSKKFWNSSKKPLPKRAPRLLGPKLPKS